MAVHGIENREAPLWSPAQRVSGGNARNTGSDDQDVEMSNAGIRRRHIAAHRIALPKFITHTN
jgi:hypothetical protein